MEPTQVKPVMEIHSKGRPNLASKYKARVEVTESFRLYNMEPTQVESLMEIYSKISLNLTCKY